MKILQNILEVSGENEDPLKEVIDVSASTSTSVINVSVQNDSLDLENNNNKEVVEVPEVIIQKILTTRYPELANFDLYETLNNHAKGKAVLLNYSNKTFLELPYQNELCEIIATYFLNFSHLKVDNDELEYLVVMKILLLFPNEIEETYFVGPVKKKTQEKANLV